MLLFTQYTSIIDWGGGGKDEVKILVRWKIRFINFSQWSTLNFSLRHIVNCRQTNNGIYQNRNLGILKYHHIHKGELISSFFQLDFYTISAEHDRSLLFFFKPFHPMWDTSLSGPLSTPLSPVLNPVAGMPLRVSMFNRNMLPKVLVFNF